jgi:RNA polymerase sigma-70 factor (ECF subfamily)
VTETIKDEVLLQKAKDGDQGAFRLLYERHRDPIFRFLFRLLGSAEIAEDITHDCFMSLIREPEESWSSGPGLLRTRLFSTARTFAMRYFQDPDQESIMNDVVQDENISKKNIRDSAPLDRNSVPEVGEAVASLSPLEREALILAEYEGLELDEIAAIVGTNVWAVSARLGAARQRLRTALANQVYSRDKT